MTLENEKYLCRFYSLPSEETLKVIFDRDGIEFDPKVTTIDDVLAQARTIYRKKFKKFFKNKKLEPQQLSEPYFSLYRLDYVINKGCLYANTFPSFNDIFEGKAWYSEDIMLKLHKEYNEAMKLDDKATLTEEEYCKIIKDGYANNELPTPLSVDSIFNKYGVISFCHNYQDPLMWGHYANGHNGVCVRFIPNPILNEIIDKSTKTYAGQYTINGKSELFFFWQNIDYLKTPEIIGLQEVNSYQQEHAKICKKFPALNDIIKYPFDFMLIKQIMRKDARWINEAETRLIFFGWTGEIQVDRFIIPKTDQAYLQLDSVILGAKISELSENSIVKRLIENSIKPHIKIKTMTPEAASYDMKIFSA